MSQTDSSYSIWLAQRIQEQPLCVQRAVGLINIFYRYRIKADRDASGRRIDPISLDPIPDDALLWIPLEPHPKHSDLWRVQAFHFDYFHMWIGARRAPIHPLLNRQFDAYQTRTICAQYDKRGIHPPYCMRTPSGRITRSMMAISPKTKVSKKTNKEPGLKTWVRTPCAVETYEDSQRTIDGCFTANIDPNELKTIIQRNDSKRNRYHVPFVDWCIHSKEPKSPTEYQNALTNAIRSDRLDLVNCLLEAGANPRFVDTRNGFGPLHLAMLSKGSDSPKILEILLNRHANQGIPLESRMGPPEALTADRRKLELYFRALI